MPQHTDHQIQTLDCVTLASCWHGDECHCHRGPYCPSFQNEKTGSETLHLWAVTGTGAASLGKSSGTEDRKQQFTLITGITNDVHM